MQIRAPVDLELGEVSKNTKLREAILTVLKLIAQN